MLLIHEAVLSLSRSFPSTLQARWICKTSPALRRGGNQDRNRPFLRTREEVEKVTAINPLLDPITSKSLRRRRPDSLADLPAGARSQRVSVVGIPNAGKSTLVNQLIGSNVCPHSQKVHTTRKNSLGVMTAGTAQVTFLDTPGIVTAEEKAKYGLEDDLCEGPATSCLDTDLLLVVHDVSNRFVRESVSKRVLRLLCANLDVPSVLVLNKMDTVPRSRRIFDLIRKLTCGQLEGRKTASRISKGPDKKDSVELYFKKREKREQKREGGGGGSKVSIRSYDDLLRVLRTDDGRNDETVEDLCLGLVGWPGFRDVFTVSALDGSGVDDLREYLATSASRKGWDFDGRVVTTEDPKRLVVDIVKSKFLEVLEHDAPYKIKPQIESWEVEADGGVLRLLLSVQSDKPRTTNLLLYHKASNLNKVAKLAEKDLQNLFHCEVFVLITVDVTHEPKTQVFNPLPVEGRGFNGGGIGLY